MDHPAEKDAPFTIPSAAWLAQALCGWHDAESGRLAGEPFPCTACLQQAGYVVEHASAARDSDDEIRHVVKVSSATYDRLTRPIPPAEQR